MRRIEGIGGPFMRGLRVLLCVDKYCFLSIYLIVDFTHYHKQPRTIDC